MNIRSPITGIFGITRQGLVAPDTFTGGMTNFRFVKYIEKHIILIVQKGYTIICENLVHYKQKKGVKIAENMAFLTYNYPHLNPIEMAFSKLKSLSRKTRLKMVEPVTDFMLDTPKLFTASDCSEYFDKMLSVAKNL